MTELEPHVVVLGAGTAWPDKEGMLKHGFAQSFCHEAISEQMDKQSREMLNILSSHLNGKVTLSLGKVMASATPSSPQGLARGLVWAAELYPHVVVLPLGLLKPNSSVKAALEILANTQCRIYAAVGDASMNLQDSLYPAAYPECIGVGSMSQGQLYQSWSRKPDVLIDESVAANVKGMRNIQLGTATATMLAVSEYLNHEFFNGQTHFNHF